MPSGPTLDRSDEVWHGWLPGLGSVAVAADGAITVEADGPDLTGDHALALRHGWGELLSHARLGFSMAAGAAIVPSGAPQRAVLVCGDAPDVATAVIALTREDWALVSDRPTPTRWIDDELVAFPRAAPLVVGEALAVDAGLAAARIRSESNAVRLDLPRRSEPARVTHLVQVRRRRPKESAFSELTGHRRFERAASVMIGGVLTPPGASRESTVNEHLRLAELPSAVLRIGTERDSSVSRLLAWIAS